MERRHIDLTTNPYFYDDLPNPVNKYNVKHLEHDKLIRKILHVLVDRESVTT